MSKENKRNLLYLIAYVFWGFVLRLIAINYAPHLNEISSFIPFSIVTLLIMGTVFMIDGRNE